MLSYGHLQTTKLVKSNSLKLPRTRLAAAQYYRFLEEESQGIRQIIGESLRNLGGNEAVVFAAPQVQINDCTCLAPSRQVSLVRGISVIHKAS